MQYLELFVQALCLEHVVHDTTIENLKMRLEIEMLRHHRDILKSDEANHDRRSASILS